MRDAQLHDPWRLLGIARDASAEEIRAAYVALVKLHPPDRDAARFEAIRDAYAWVSDPRAQARRKVMGPPPITSFDALRDSIRSAGFGPTEAGSWFAVARERRKRRRRAK